MKTNEEIIEEEFDKKFDSIKSVKYDEIRGVYFVRMSNIKSFLFEKLLQQKQDIVEKIEKMIDSAEDLDYRIYTNANSSEENLILQEGFLLGQQMILDILKTQPKSN